MYVCIYVCLHVFMYVYMYAFMHTCIYVSMYQWCTHASLLMFHDVCMYVCMFACMYCMYVCMYACMFIGNKNSTNFAPNMIFNRKSQPQSFFLSFSFSHFRVVKPQFNYSRPKIVQKSRSHSPLHFVLGNICDSRQKMG